MKKGKKIVIGVAAVAVVAGGFYAVSGGSRGEAQLPQVSVTKAETGDVEDIVDATGTVLFTGKRTDKKSIFCRRGFRLKGYKTCGI